MTGLSTTAAGAANIRAAVRLTFPPKRGTLLAGNWALTDSEVLVRGMALIKTIAGLLQLACARSLGPSGQEEWM